MAAASAFLFLTLLTAQPPEQLIITGARVLDGSGNPAAILDVAVQDGVIIAVGDLSGESSGSTVDGSGLVLAPGFIDLHSHSTRGLLEKPEVPTQVSQGITTLVVGADGSSPFPPGPYLNRLQANGTAVNVAVLVGHGTVRRAVLGDDFKRESTPHEVQAMVSLVRLAMRQGVYGLSSGLEYDPGFYSTTEELVSLSLEAAAHGGFYMTHMRDEEDGFVAALDEAIEIGRRAKIPVQISHIKLGNTRVWGRAAESLQKIESAAREGIDITADCYPYDAWASGLSILVPSRRFEDRSEVAEAFDKIGGPHNVLITRYSPDPSYEFKNLTEIARSRGISEVDLYIEMIQKGGAGIVGRSMNVDDVDTFYRHPQVMVGSDGGSDSRHPRMSGTFPRVLGRFVRDRGLFPLAVAVQKMTSLPARRLGLADRGLIRPGYRADLVLFDADTVVDRSTFQEPSLLSVGIKAVWVNGVQVWDGETTTGLRPGTVLRR